MKALAVFHDEGGHVLDPLLKPGFRHCFAALASGNYWIRIDAQTGTPVIEVVAASDFDLAAFYREEGYTVIETQQRDGGPSGPFVLTNCVGLVKTVLGLAAPLVVTPRQLYRRLNGLPGFSSSKPKLPDPVPPPPPPPVRAEVVADPSNRKAELARRNRRSTILNSAQGVTSEAPLGRPSAKLGG